MHRGLAKRDKLLNAAEFDLAFRQGERDHGPLFTVIYCTNGLERARLGLAVSRRVSHKAVIRNLIKRQIREAFRRNREILCGFDCVVIAKPRAAECERSALYSSLIKHWQKISGNA